MRCTLCETENAEDAGECLNCGKQLMLEGEVEVDQEPIEGLEVTILDPLESAAGAVARIPELEETLIVQPGLQVTVEPIQVERTPIEERLDAPVNWTGELTEMESGRSEDDGVRTAAPVDTGICPWCTTPSTGAVCDNCGRRRSRFTAEPVREARALTREQKELIRCPACFARVPRGPRCVECHVPMTPKEAI